MNKVFRFEIIRRPNGRFGWVFVLRRGDRRRVLARSARDYRTREKVVEAIGRMEGADVVDGTGGDAVLFPLPTTSFRIIPGVVPLMVNEFPGDLDTQFRGQALGAEASPRPAALEAAKPKPKARAKRSKPKPRRSGARSAA